MWKSNFTWSDQIVPFIVHVVRMFSFLNIGAESVNDSGWGHLQIYKTFAINQLHIIGMVFRFFNISTGNAVDYANTHNWCVPVQLCEFRNVSQLLQFIYLLAHIKSKCAQNSEVLFECGPMSMIVNDNTNLMFVY